MTVKDLVTVQVNTHLSNFSVKNLASTINQVSKTKVVGSSFYAKFDAFGRHLSDPFIQTDMCQLKKHQTTKSQKLLFIAIT